MKKYVLEVETLSPLHLGAGKADVILDAEVVHDEFGLPYFPAKRLKGLLYESAVELAEISNETWFTVRDIQVLFGQESISEACFSIENLYLPDYENLRSGWTYLNDKYKGLFQAKDILSMYTEIRYQTSIDSESGTAKDGSLHNMRVIDTGITFTGELVLYDDNAVNKKILEMAVKNLRFAGAKRNRGCGKIRCKMF